MKKKYIVYKTTNLLNGKIYIGFHTVINDNYDDGYLGSGVLLLKAIEKYGKENFTRDTLKEFDNSKDAFSYEHELVNEEFILRDDTYNVSLGGKNCILFGENNGFYGKKHTTESLLKIAEGRKRFYEQNGYIVKSKYHCILDNQEFFSLVQIKNYFRKNEENISLKHIILRVTDPNSDNFFINETFNVRAKLLRQRIIEHKIKMKKFLGESSSKRFKGIPKSPEQKKKMSDSAIGKKCDWNLITNRDPEKIRKTREKHIGMKRTKDTCDNISEAIKTAYSTGILKSTKGCKYYYDPLDTSKIIRVYDGEVPPDGWVNGTAKNLGKESYYNKDTFEVKRFAKGEAPEGWVKGGHATVKKIKKSNESDIFRE